LTFAAADIGRHRTVIHNGIVLQTMKLLASLINAQLGPRTLSGQSGGNAARFVFASAADHRVCPKEFVSRSVVKKSQKLYHFFTVSLPVSRFCGFGCLSRTIGSGRSGGGHVHSWLLRRRMGARRFRRRLDRGSTVLEIVFELLESGGKGRWLRGRNALALVLHDLGVGARFLELLTEEGGDLEELFGRDIVELTFGQFPLDGFLPGGELSQVFLMGGEELFLKGFKFEGTKAPEQVPELAVPGD